MLLDNALQFLYRHGMVPDLFGINQCGRAALTHPQAVGFGAVDAAAGVTVADGPVPLESLKNYPL